VDTQTAYASDEGWLEQLKQYLDDNFIFLKTQLEAEVPKVQFHIPQSIYLAWVDISAYLEHRADKIQCSAGLCATWGIDRRRQDVRPQCRRIYPHQYRLS
jgi:bifunctional pyridoxal-dependent enzyme with beta-cystathionase and maltose regulon repressor activities